MTNCNYPDCENPIIAKGYCMTHYRRLKRNGTVETKNHMGKTACAECGLTGAVTRKGLCPKCYQKLLYWGNKKESIILMKKEWADYTPEQIEAYIERILRVYRKHGYPYTVLSDEERQQEFAAYMKYDTSNLIRDGIIHQTPHAIRLCWHYFHHALDIRCSDKPSPMEAFNDDDLFRRVMRNRLKCGTYISDAGIRKAFKKGGGSQAVSNFRPTAAKAIYERYAGENATVYDFSAGFAGRMLGAIGANNVKRYIGVDPSTKTYTGLLQIAGEFGNKQIDLYNVGSEDFYSPDTLVDLCFSSPPYFDTEQYADEPTQSYIKYPTYEKWINGFVKDTAMNCWKMLKPSGKMIINIAPTRKYKHLDMDYINICRLIGFVDVDTLKMRLSSFRETDSEYKHESVYVLEKPYSTNG